MTRSASRLVPALFTLLALVGVPASAQTLAEAPRATAAVAVVDVAALDAYFAEALEDWPIPGFSV
ncbi:MAG: hypothetical protein KJP18_11485, partial [Gemmatimonadetes bacterium]|nr:hypothetical protein [Gemmatimonadota bacterium]